MDSIDPATCGEDVDHGKEVSFELLDASRRAFFFAVDDRPVRYSSLPKIARKEG